MSYGRADTSAKVGFRPYYLTDAFGAAHLSGYGSGLGQGHNPFTPRAWQLHGMGEYRFGRPFDPWTLYSETAPGLHGLAALGAGGDVVAQAADELRNSGHITQAEHDAILEGSMSFQDVLGFDPTDEASWYDAVGLLRQWNNELIALEQQYGQAGAELRQTSGPGSGSPEFQQFGRDLVGRRQEYNAIAAKFVELYTLVMGSTPSGLSGLGIAIVVWAVGAAAAIVAVYFGYQAFQRWHEQNDINRIKAQTAQTRAQTQQSNCEFLHQALAKAQASGDTITAQTILASLKQCGEGGGAPMSELEKWITSNMKWIGVGVGAVVVLPGLLGRRRR